MLGLTESYEKILEYFEEQKKGFPQKKIEKLKIKQAVEVKKQSEIIKEPSIEDFAELKVPVTFSKKGKSKGFDIRQFELLMRTKLIEEYKINQSYERPYIAVGELDNCMRQNYYSRLKYQVDVSELFKFSYLYLIQQVGKKVHSIFQELYNFTEVEKTVVSERYKVKGRADAIKENNLYEIKTYDEQKLGAKNKYEEKDYNQAAIYTHILNHEYNYAIDNITIIYVPRDLKKIYTFDLKPDDRRAKEMLERAPVLLKYIEHNTVADPFGATKEHCKYCLYKNYCIKDVYKNIAPPYIEKEKIKETSKEDKVAFLL